MVRPLLVHGVWLLAFTFVAYFGLLVYCDIVRPEESGYQAVMIRRQMVVVRLDDRPDTPAARAGLRPGDIIVAADGRRIAASDDWTRVEANIEYRRPIRLLIQRGSGTLERLLTFVPAGWDYWTTEPGVVLLLTLAIQCVALALAIVVVYTRPQDQVAVLGAWTLFTVAVYMIVLPDRFAAVWRDLPLVVGGLFWVPYVSGQAAAAVLFTFFVSFPRRLIHSPWLWAAVWIPIAVVLVRPITHAWLWVYRPTSNSSADGRALMIVTGGYLLAGLAALVVNYGRLEDRNERRRLRLVVVGATAGLGPDLLAIAIARLRPEANLATSIFTSRLMVVGTMSLLLFPTSFAYTILRHRVFGIRLMIRQGARYAVARGALLSLVPVLGLFLLADVLVRGDRPLAVILARRAPVYLVIATVAVVAHLQRRQWLEALDRRFFREQYHASRLLGQIAEDMRAGCDVAHVAPRVVAQVNAALHPEFVALLVRPPADLSYASFVSTPVGLAPPRLRVDSTVMAVLRVLRTPLDVSADSWLMQRVPPAELQLLLDARVGLLVPVVTTAGHAEAVLTLGVKRSEEPYTKEDGQLLMTIATQLALVLERPALTQLQAVPRLSECPQCGACYDGPTANCVSDGARLRTMELPRLFAARYRLDRRVGTGGFGTVYEAFDIALDRRVALKTIRDDLLTRPGVAARFQREARLAASLMHRHVVTVHDFGVDVSGAAFLVMEYLEGVTLRDALHRERYLQPARALAIMRAVCAAIDLAHRRHFIHRDLKPENIFLTPEGPDQTVKVLDFGVARALDDPAGRHTEVGVLVGSLRYMAPEQLRGEDVECAADLWALGVIAYELLTGTHPFAVDPLGDVVASPLGESVGAGMTSLTVPTAWTACFREVLAFEAARRPRTATALLSALERALAPIAA